MIRFWCECGRQLQARDGDVGRLAACPVCSKTTTVPETDQPGPPNRPDREQVQPGRSAPPIDKQDESDRDPSRPPQPRRRREEPAPASSGLATASLIFGILSFPCMFGALTGIPAIIMGFMALSKIGQSKGRLGGRGNAIAGLALGGVGILLGLLLIPAMFYSVWKVRDAAARVQDSNNLKQMGLAMHNYHSNYNTFPAATAYRTKDGKPGLSWRVAMLPYIEQDFLYQQFRLDEAWDSPHNSQFLTRMPRIYLQPGQQPDGRGLTHYQVFVGPGTVFEPRQGPQRPFLQGAIVPGVRMTDITDGSSNTILIATARDGVPWTKPDDLPYDPNGPLPALGGLSGDYFQVLFADGSVRRISKQTSENILRLLITRNDGMAIPAFD